ncbi:DUF1778 domain-containing protein [Luteimonas sp. RC10]|uniref:type II toxin-antitoxin system TacA family antitoxin n=1 Tax=Luteimonas sp. RC10 TaxID=2587035 RepID=UPI00161A6703|nr:DUF1778 domain-containing protein [Luteimonas sp. RC10]MBB3344598.1 uncharacterized protein (DUF1778 family) [Luteimonas sp. RC10]
MRNAAARLDLRIDARDKDRIARAAALRGMSVSAFVRSAVLREADTAIAADTTVALSPAESRRFLAALDAPFQPNDRLRKAMKRAVRLTGRR